MHERERDKLPLSPLRNVCFGQALFSSAPASWARSRGVATCKWRQQVTLLAYAYAHASPMHMPLLCTCLSYAHASPMLYRLSLDLQSDLTYRLNLPT